LKAVGLAEARLKATECRGLLAEGIDPIAARDAVRAQWAVEDARAITFDSCADAYIKAHSSAWKNEKHIAQWKATIKTYASPVSVCAGYSFMPANAALRCQSNKAASSSWAHDDGAIGADL
jgi:hypothetical protein